MLSGSMQRARQKVFARSRRSRGTHAPKRETAMVRATKRTKIVATIGPASRDPEMLRQMFLAGVNVVRLNFSHGTHEEHAKVIEDVRRVSRDLGLHIAVLQDLPGPKVRTGSLNGAASVKLEPGAHFMLTTRQVAGSVAGVSVSYAELPRD